MKGYFSAATMACLLRRFPAFRGRRAAGLGVLALSSAWPRVSLAGDSPLQPAEDPFFVAGLLGFASAGLNFGVGGRVGKTFLNGIYVGASFVYQTGESELVGDTTVNGMQVTSSVTNTSSLFFTGAEGGYDFNFKYIVLRPYLGLGIADLTAGSNVTGTFVSNSAVRLVAWPGIQASYNIPHTIGFVGLDVHLLTEEGGPSLGFFATGGVRFGGSD